MTDPWAAPDELAAQVPPPPPAAPAPAAVPPQPYAPAPQPYAPPAPYAGSYTAPAQPPPTWATPRPVVARAGRLDPDPWAVRGWYGGGSVVVRLLAGAALLLGLLTVMFAAGFVDERSYLADERAYYLTAHGTIEWDQRDPSSEPTFTGRVPEYGGVVVPLGDSVDDVDVYPNHAITLLVMPGDSTDYVLPSDRADPDFVLVLAVVAGLLTIAAATATVLVARLRRVDTEPVRHVAATVPEGDPPGPLHAGAPRRTAATIAQLVTAAGLLLTAWPAALTAVHTTHSAVSRVTADADVVRGNDDVGNDTLVVRYYDDRSGGQNIRPLTPAERRSGLREGDRTTVAWPDPADEIGHGKAVAVGAYAAAATLFALFLLWRALSWPVRVRRALREPPRPVEVTAWARVVRRRVWLFLLPDEAATAGRVVAVPVVNDRDLPAALTGTVYVHGVLKPGRAVVVRAPSGDALLPTGPARGALLAEATFLPSSPPKVPRQLGWNAAW